MKKYNIKSPFSLKLSQMRTHDVGYVGGGGWRRTKKGFYTSAERWVLPEDDTHIVMVEKTESGLVCVPIPWMLNLVVEKVADMPSGWIFVKPFTVK